MRSRLTYILFTLALLGSIMMTGRAAAQTPDATPVSDAGAWQLADTREFDVDSQFAALSPDGRWLASFSTDSGFCVRDVETLTPQCAGERLQVREETITWAPDSTAVAFALNATRYGFESDIYAYELETGQLANLTDDGVEGNLIDMLDDDPPIDDVPTWSPDSQQIAFARSFTGDEEAGSTSIMRIDRDGGEPVDVLELDIEQPMTVWMPMHWLPDGSLLYSQISSELDDPRNGVWKVGVDDGGSPLQVVPGDNSSDVPAPMVVAVNSGQGSAIVYSYWLAGQLGFDAEQPLFWMVDLKSGDMEPLASGDGAGDAMVIAAGFSPDGETVMLVTVDAGQKTLTLVDLATGDAATFEHGTFDTLASEVVIQWAETDTVLLQRPTGPLLVTLEPTG